MPGWYFAVFSALVPQDPTPPAEPRIEWQRTLADALAVQQATGKPLLICVNTDGEVFCDRFANETYLDPEFVASTHGWVCVVASPDRHNETDYDGRGRRIECPRFPGCTCSEHIAIEPELFRRWFKNERYAPRHVGVDRDGKVLFDRFLDRSMQDAIDLIGRHKADTAEPAVPTHPAELLQRRDARSRRALEAHWLAQDKAGRRAILQSAATAATEPLDLLRMGMRDDDDGVFAAAARALASAASPASAIDLQDALARATGAERDAVSTAAAQLAKTDAATAQFVTHHRAAQQGLERARKPPFAAIPTTPVAERDRAAIEADLDAADRAVRQSPDDAPALLAQALANLELALYLLPSGDGTVPLWFEDSRRAAARAEPHASPQQLPMAQGLQAIALHQVGDAAAAPKAAAALAAIERTPAFDASPRWVGTLLQAAARSHAALAYAAVQQDPRAQAPDAVATAAFAFAALQNHPLSTAQDAQDAQALLTFAGARQDATALLARAVRRCPDARELHEAFRLRLLADRGAAALRREYAAFADAVADAATAQWFAGYAALVAAEQHVRDREREFATQAYGDAIERLHQSAAANADFADSANHFAVLARAGRALERHLGGDASGAVDDLLAALALRPASMQERDGLGRTPDAMLRRIARELQEQGNAQQAARLPAG